MDPMFFGFRHYADLLKYTACLSEECIGEFQSGKIYRATISFGACIKLPVIVKIWKGSNATNDLSLMQEVTFLRHEKVNVEPGVIKLIGCCWDGINLGVIYDLNPHGTLHSLLLHDNFTWARRIKVIYWLARLLKAFHRKNPPHGPFIVHNIDAEHILVDWDYTPKLFDFSMVTGGGIFPSEKELAAEHSLDLGELSTQGAVLQFGRLVLSLISKKRIEKNYIADDNIDLGPTVVHGSFEEEPYFSRSDGVLVSELAFWCLKNSPADRPCMKKVVLRLEQLNIVKFHKKDVLAVLQKKGPIFF